MQTQRTLSPKISVSLATAVGAASTKAAIVSLSITPGSMNAVNGSKTLVLSTTSSIKLEHSFTSFTVPGGEPPVMRRSVAVDALGGVDMRAATGKGVDFNFKESSAFGYGLMKFGTFSTGTQFSVGGIGHGLRLIPLKFTDDLGNPVLGLAEMDFDRVGRPGYANLLNFWYSNDPSVEELRWDAGAQQVFEVGPTPVPEPRGAAAVLLAGLAAVAQSRRRKPQARGLGALAAGMGGLVARAGREDS